MIDFHFAPTPNGLKLRLFLEEAQIPYRTVRVYLMKGEQFRPEFLEISPNNKIPAIVDHEPGDGGAPLAMFESGAIMLYLADKVGRLIPTDMRRRAEVVQWLFWQVSGLGPMAGQIEHFNVYAKERVPYAIERYTRETRRLFGVLDRRLDGREFIAGEFSLADIACYAWIVPHAILGQKLEDFPNLARWFATIKARPATIRAYAGVEDAHAPVTSAAESAMRRAG